MLITKQEEKNFCDTLNIKLNIFGTNLKFSIPRKKPSLIRMTQPRSTAEINVGSECAYFYDAIYNSVSCRFREIFPKEFNKRNKRGKGWSNRLKRQSGNIFVREYFYSTFNYRHGKDTADFGFEINIYYDVDSKNLNDPDDLKEMVIKLIDTESALFYDREDSLFTANIIAGINWRDECFNGVMWQGYDEYINGCLVSRNWLLPIGRHHYLKIKLSCERTQSLSIENAFLVFCQKFMSDMHVAFEEVNETKNLTPEYWKFSNKPARDILSGSSPWKQALIEYENGTERHIQAGERKGIMAIVNRIIHSNTAKNLLIASFVLWVFLFIYGGYELYLYINSTYDADTRAQYFSYISILLMLPTIVEMIKNKLD